MRSSLGVAIPLAPKQPISAYPRSSANTITTFGGRSSAIVTQVNVRRINRDRRGIILSPVIQGSASLPGIGDAAEPDVRRAAVGGALATSAGQVARAVEVAAQKRAPTLHALRHAGLLRVVAGIRSLGIAGGTGRVIVRPIPVGAPLPDVTRHVDQPVPIRRERAHRGGGPEPVGQSVLIGKVALPVIHLPLSTGEQFIAPHVLFAVESAPRGEFPFRLSRQS